MDIDIHIPLIVFIKNVFLGIVCHQGIDKLAKKVMIDVNYWCPPIYNWNIH